MYFWRIENLKAELASRPMTDREVLPYFVVEGALTSLALSVATSSLNLWSGLDLVWNFGLSVFGSIYWFRQNGGLRGHQFLQRILAIGWVVGLRWCAWVVPLYCVLLVTEVIEDEMNAVEFLFNIVINTLLVRRMGFHLQDVAARTLPAQTQAQPSSS